MKSNNDNKTIFISHRSIDKDFANKLIDALSILGIPNNLFFCSSLPGNDVEEKISTEVKNALNISKINIVILSKGYYQSSYCLNEAGIIWFQDKPCIVMALPEITDANMYGFLNNENKIRRFDNKDDLLFIYDKISDLYNTQNINHQVLERKISDAIKSFSELIKGRNIKNPEKKSKINLTEDEIMLMYFFAKQQKRKHNINELKLTFTISEVVQVDIDNALDLLSASGYGSLDGDYFIIDINQFRKLNEFPVDDKVSKIIKKHYLRRKDVFLDLYKKGKFDEIDKLFILYLIETKTNSLGDRWLADAQITDIKEWQSNNILNDKLSNNYGSCLNKFVNNNLCYPSDYTSNGNPRAFTIHKSLVEYFENVDDFIKIELTNIKDKNTVELPF